MAKKKGRKQGGRSTSKKTVSAGGKKGRSAAGKKSAAPEKKGTRAVAKKGAAALARTRHRRLRIGMLATSSFGGQGKIVNGLFARARFGKMFRQDGGEFGFLFR